VLKGRVLDVDVEWEEVVREVESLKEASKLRLPYSGGKKEGCVNLVGSLILQCGKESVSGSEVCKRCEVQIKKNGGVSTYGEIEERKRCYESGEVFVGNNKKKAVSYVSVMRKNKLSEEDVKTAALLQGVYVDPEHFKEVVVKEKKSKGRPTKEKTVTVSEVSDLFAELMPVCKEACEELVEELVEESDVEKKEKIAAELAEEEAKAAEKAAEKAVKDSEKAVKALEKAAKAAEKAVKDASKAAEKAVKDAEKKAKDDAKLAEKEAKEAEKAAKQAVKDAEKAAEKAVKDAEKAEKDAAKEAEKKVKEEAKAAEKAEKQAAKLAEQKAKKAEKAAEKEKEKEKKDVVKEDVVERVTKVVKRIKYEGTEYMHEKATDVVYSLSGEEVGKWNKETSEIVFAEPDSESDSEEEEEEEYLE